MNNRRGRLAQQIPCLSAGKLLNLTMFNGLWYLIRKGFRGMSPLARISRSVKGGSNKVLLSCPPLLANSYAITCVFILNYSGTNTCYSL